MSESTNTVAIIVAAGKGTRMGGQAKQWRDLDGMRVVDRSIATFLKHPLIDQVVLVVPNGELQRQKDFTNCAVVEGGDSRQASVRNALEFLADIPPNKVLIHDAARPLVSEQTITEVVTALDHSPAAAPGLPLADTLWKGENGVEAIVDRSGLWRAQTPQGFAFSQLLEAHRAAPLGATDDVSIAMESGIPIAITPGDARNFKITTMDDFSRAMRELRGNMKVRIGNGFDVHAFEDGDAVILCGIKIPFEKKLKGHSDADVAMHALTDAIYGALAEGDIGRHFPPSDPQWKNADSVIFLKDAVQLADEQGLKIGNLDITIMCERPKIGPHADAMQENLAAITGADRGAVSVKATTTEQLGFTGREEGIAAMASVLLVGK